MKRESKILILAGVCAMLSMAGCGSSLPDMTDEQVNAIGEYAAVTLLKYDANSKSRLVDQATLEQIELQEAQQVQANIEPEIIGGGKNDTEQQVVIDNTQDTGATMASSLEDFLELPAGMSLTYAGYEVGQSYQEDGDLYFSLEASAGKQLLILSFTLENQSGEDKELRLLDQRNSYRITVNDEYTRTALTTMLENDLATFIGTIRAGESRTMVLLTEIDPDKVAQVDTIAIKFKNMQTSYAQQVL